MLLPPEMRTFLMRSLKTNLPRRDFLKWLLASGVATFCKPQLLSAASAAKPIFRSIPSSGETIPAIGMGSWITFDIDLHSDIPIDQEALETRVRVMQSFFQHGGTLVDSSPMYGRSEDVIGYCLKKLGATDKVFAATKVWTWFQQVGIAQMQESRELWGVPRFDLMQIHNMLGWEGHLETLKAWKADGRIRYLGITTSHGRRHDDLIQVLKTESFDFVQFTYNMLDREAEARLLPLAAERGCAVIINRPFQGGNLFSHVHNKPLPNWALEFECTNWAQFFLKFIISHPAVTCAIPATSRVDHMEQNMGACFGSLPDSKARQRMLQYFQQL